MKKEVRASVVRAMDTLVNCINDEDIIMAWLSCGVADGDITKETTDEDLECYYEDDEDYRQLMGLFLRLMNRARQSGGLYSDRVTTKEGNEGEWKPCD